MTPDIMIRKLISFGISPNILAFIQNSIYARQVHYQYQDIDNVFLTFRGLPQGSVLSPLLYNIYVFEVAGGYVPTCNIVQYADDIAIFYS